MSVSALLAGVKGALADAYPRRVTVVGEISNFKFLVVGSKPPYLTAVYDINEDLLEEGREKTAEALDRYWNYKNGTDEWSGLSYGRETVTL